MSQSPCVGLTGYHIPEITSSGMSHADDLWISPETLGSLQNPIYSSDLFWVTYNYGHLKLNASIKIAEFYLKDINGNKIKRRTFDINMDLKFNKRLQSYNK